MNSPRPVPWIRIIAALWLFAAFATVPARAITLELQRRDPATGAILLQPETVDLMFTPQWVYDGLRPNGDTYGDLMLCYGLGPQIMTDTLGDRLLADRAVGMAGHFGEAFGLLSAMMIDFAGRRGFIYLIGGVGADPDRQPGSYSSMSRWEEEIVTALFRYELLKD